MRLNRCEGLLRIDLAHGPRVALEECDGDVQPSFRVSSVEPLQTRYLDAEVFRLGARLRAGRAFPLS